MQLDIGNGTKTTVPESWEQVTLAAHIKAQEARLQHRDSAQEVLVQTIMALCDMSRKQVIMLDSDTADIIADAITFYFTTAPEPMQVTTFEVNGETMIVPDQIGKRSFGEFIDMDNALVANA